MKNMADRTPDAMIDNSLSSPEKSAYVFLFRDSGRVLIVSLLILFIWTVALAGMRWYTGSLPFADEGARAGVHLLEQGHRVFSGQRPHVDFISPMGVFQYMLVHLGILICGVKGAALTMGYLAFMPMVLISTWVICSKRMAYLPSSFITIAAVSLMLGANALGTPLPASSYETVYNRLGLAMISPLLVAALLPKIRCGDFVDGICIGLMLGCAFFLKINFGIGGILLLLLGVFAKKIPISKLTLIFAGFLTVTVIVAVYLHGRLDAFFFDMFRLIKNSGSNVASICVTKAWFNLLDVNFGLMILSVCLWGGIAAGNGSSISGDARKPRFFVNFTKNLTILIIAAAIVFFVMVGCMKLDKFMFPYIFIFAVFGWTDAIFRNQPTWRGFVIGMLGFVCAFFFAFGQTQSTVNALRHRLLINNSARRYCLLTNPALNDMPFILDGMPVAENLNLGTELLAKNRVPKNYVVYSLTMFNNWPLLYGSAYRKGDWAWLHYGLLFDGSHQPSRHELFDDVDAVLVSKKDNYANYSKEILSRYGQYFYDNYYLKDENSDWRLYLKKSSAVK